MKNYLITAFVIVLIAACTKTENDEIYKKSNYEFEGIWVNPEYVDSAYVATKSNDFEDDKGGLKFNADGTFMHRSNSGWCGTPPISYSNYSGTWTKFPDNTLFIETEYWGGVTSFTIEIIEIENDKMVYRLVYAEN